MANLEQIAAGLDELRSEGRSSAWIDPKNTWCVTFKLQDTVTKGEPFWLQVVGGMLNMQYLDEDEPLTRLKADVDEFPEEFGLIAWDICLYATFEMPWDYAMSLPGLVDRIARQYFGLNQDYQVTYRVENRGAER